MIPNFVQSPTYCDLKMCLSYYLKLVSHKSPHDIYKEKSQLIPNFVISLWGGREVQGPPTNCDLNMWFVITQNTFSHDKSA